MTDTPFDVVSLIALVTLPFWILGGIRAIKAILRHTDRLSPDRGVALFMAAGMPLLLVGAAVPVSFGMRHLDRAMVYERCASPYPNALDPLNGCPDWTVRAAERQATDQQKAEVRQRLAMRAVAPAGSGPCSPRRRRLGYCG